MQGKLNMNKKNNYKKRSAREDNNLGDELSNYTINNKQSAKNNEKTFAWIPPLAVFMITMVVFYVYKIFPLGENTIAWCDMKQQVIPLLMQFKEILSGNQSVIFQMYNAGGANFWGIFFFFISSPFSLLVMFTEKVDIVTSINLIVLMKLMLASFFAMLLFKEILPRNLPFINAGFSILYALSGFPLMFYQNIVWLDMVYLFPILLIGLNRLIYKNKIFLFVLTLTCTFIVNYYMSYMVIVFLILYMGIYSLNSQGSNSHFVAITRFIFASLLSGALSSFVWIPSLFQYLKSARVSDLINTISNSSFISHIHTSLSVILTTSLLAVVYLLAIAFLGITSSNNTNAHKFKTPGKLVLLFSLLLLPLFVEPINKMWHTGSYQAFPARYGYITTLIGLVLTGFYFSEMSFLKKPKLTDTPNMTQMDVLTKNSQEDEFSKNASMLNKVFSVSSYIISLLSVLGIGIYSVITSIRDRENICAYTSTLWNDKKSFEGLLQIFLLFATSHLIIIILGATRKIKREFFVFCFLILIVFETFFSVSVFVGYPSNNPSSYKTIIDLQGKIEDEEIYRVKNFDKYFDVNLTGGLGYNSLATYTSLTSKRYMTLIKNLGYSSYWMEINSSQGSIFTDSLFANKYIISRRGNDPIGDQIIYSNEEFQLTKSDNSMKIASLVSIPDLEKVRELYNGDRFEIQNNMFELVFNTKEKLFKRIAPTEKINVEISNQKEDSESKTIINKTNEGDESIIRYIINIEGKKILYFDCFDKVTNNLEEPINKSFKVTVNGEEIQNEYPLQDKNGLLNLGEFANEQVIVDVKVLKNVKSKSFGLASFDMKVFDSYVKRGISQNSSTTIKQRDNKLFIETNSKDIANSYLLLSIPYDESFQGYVNNKRVKIERVFHGLMAIKLENGINNIEITFIPQGFILGVAISLLGLLLGILGWYKRDWINSLKFVKILKLPVKYGFGVLFVLVIFAIYILPVAINLIK